MMSRWWAIVALSGFAAIGGSSPANAQAAASAPELGLELNDARDVNGVCRLTYLVVNRTATPLDELAYEVVVFDGDNRFSQILILEFGNLPVQKTKVVQFDIGDSQCSGISRLLINNMSKCASGGETLPICLAALKTTSRIPIVFGQ